MLNLRSSNSFWATLIKINLLALVFFLFFSLLTLLGLAGVTYSYLQNFATASQTSLPELWQMAQTVKSTTKQDQRQQITFLLLGTDQDSARNLQATLTDTMMLVKINLTTGQIVTLPIPRDLWHQGYQTKINALYSYGDKFSPNHPEQFVATSLNEFLGVSIDHILVLSIDDLVQLLALVGEIEIDVPQGFVDDQYPREGIDPNTTDDKTVLYETIEFKSGLQTFDQQKALKYIRSRKSEDSAVGSDLSRSSRQQQVIMAIINKIASPKFLSSPDKTGSLLKFYNDHFEKYWPLTDLLSAAIKLLPQAQTITFTSLAIPVFPDDPAGLIYHPDPKFYQNLWVYAEKSPGNLNQAIPQLLNL